MIVEDNRMILQCSTMRGGDIHGEAQKDMMTRDVQRLRAEAQVSVG